MTADTRTEFERDQDQRIVELEGQVTELTAGLETIAAFAPGNGDVCEIIAQRARALLAKLEPK